MKLPSNMPVEATKLEYRAANDDKKHLQIWLIVRTLAFWILAIIVSVAGILAAVILVPVGYTMAGSAVDWTQAVEGGAVAVGGILSLLPAMIMIAFDDTKPGGWRRH